MYQLLTICLADYGPTCFGLSVRHYIAQPLLSLSNKLEQFSLISFFSDRELNENLCNKLLLWAKNAMDEQFRDCVELFL